jgi:hypothetical protein
MFQTKEVRVGLALVAALVGIGVSGTAAALPEVIVGSHLVQDNSTADTQVQPVDPAEAEESDSVNSDDDAETTSN